MLQCVSPYPLSSKYLVNPLIHHSRLGCISSFGLLPEPYEVGVVKGIYLLVLGSHRICSSWVLLQQCYDIIAHVWPRVSGTLIHLITHGRAKETIPDSLFFLPCVRLRSQAHSLWIWVVLWVSKLIDYYVSDCVPLLGSRTSESS